MHTHHPRIMRGYSARRRRVRNLLAPSYRAQHPVSTILNIVVWHQVSGSGSGGQGSLQPHFGEPCGTLPVEGESIVAEQWEDDEETDTLVLEQCATVLDRLHERVVRSVVSQGAPSCQRASTAYRCCRP